MLSSLGFILGFCVFPSFPVLCGFFLFATLVSVIFVVFLFTCQAICPEVVDVCVIISLCIFICTFHFFLCICGSILFVWWFYCLFLRVNSAERPGVFL